MRSRRRPTAAASVAMAAAMAVALWAAPAWAAHAGAGAAVTALVPQPVGVVGQQDPGDDVGPPQPALQLSESLLGFDATPVGSRSERTVTAFSVGGAELDIEELSITDGDVGDFSVGDESCTQAPIPPDDSCTITVVFEPDAAGERNALLVIASDDPGRLHRVELTGFGLAMPALVVSQERLDFAEVEIGERTTRSVMVTSVGDPPLDVEAATVQGPAAGMFGVDVDGCSGRTLFLGDTCEVQVSFAPDEEGAAAASLVISSDASGSPHTVALAGSGVADADGGPGSEEGPQLVVVPDLRGLAVADAEQAVDEVGLLLQVPEGELPDGATVEEQDPGAGAEVAAGTPIAVTLSSVLVPPDVTVGGWLPWLVGALVAAAFAVSRLRVRRRRWVRRHVRFRTRRPLPEMSAGPADQRGSHAVTLTIRHDAGEQTFEEVPG